MNVYPDTFLVARLPISGRLRNALRDHTTRALRGEFSSIGALETVGDIRRATDIELMRLPNVAAKSVQDLRELVGYIAPIGNETEDQDIERDRIRDMIDTMTNDRARALDFIFSLSYLAKLNDPTERKKVIEETVGDVIEAITDDYDAAIARGEV